MNSFSFYENNQNIQIAHRGFSSLYPENTMIAFKKAIKKTKMIELDVAFSKDAVAVVIHDDTLLRTSNVEKIFPLKKDSHIDEFTLDELKQLDFSSWFDKNLKLQTISTLEEVLTFCKKKEVYVNIEIKDLTLSPFHKKAVKKVVKIIDECKMSKSVIVSSFVSEYIIQLNKKYKHIKKAFLCEDVNSIYLLEFLLKHNIEAFHCSDEIVEEELVQELLEHGIYTCVFTVNDEKRKDELFSWGVKGVFTDNLSHI